MKRGPSRLTALLSVTALFLVGVLVGVLGTHLFYFRALGQPGGLAAVGLKLVAADLDRRLDLTAEQEKQVAAILGDARARFAAIRAEISPEIMAVAKESQARIAEILDARQKAAFERFRAEHTAWLEKQLAGNR